MNTKTWKEAVDEAIELHDSEALEQLAIRMADVLEKQRREGLHWCEAEGYDAGYIQRMLAKGFSSEEVLQLANERKGNAFK